MLEKLRLRQFCNCCTLRTGSLVIGTVGWLFSLMNAMTIESFESVPPVNATQSEIDEIEDEQGRGLSIFTTILSFGLSVALVIGVYKDDRRFMLPWLCVRFLEIIMMCLATLVLFFAMFVALPALAFATLFLIMLLITGSFTYCWLCVWSLYQDLGETMTTLQPMTAQEIQMIEQGPYGYINPEEEWKQPPQEMV